MNPSCAHEWADVQGGGRFCRRCGAVEAAPVPARVTAEQAAAMLGFRSVRSVWRLVAAGALRPLPTPRRPRHFAGPAVAALATTGRRPARF